MSEVFILGAGFSRAISAQMPLTRGLTEEVFSRFKQKDDISPDIRAMLEEDFEKALTYLATETPWLRESENLRNRALYLELTHFIRAVIHEKSKGPFVWGTNNPPLWLEALITHWHKNRCTVITLNYDTLIERVASSTYWESRSESIPTGDLYAIDLTPAGQRGTTTIISQSNIKTFRLFKLHGSINWFYSGRSQFYGENLFFVPCEGGVDGSFDTLMERDPEQLHWDHVGDKMALIIPPILDKTIFFQHESLRSMWLQAGQAIRDAKKVVCMGYSLPTGDLTMGQFLKTSAPKHSIPFHLINKSPMVEHFQNVIGKTHYDFHQDVGDLDSVPHFVVNHCVSNKKDRDYVIRMTQWQKPEKDTQPPQESE